MATYSNYRAVKFTPTTANYELLTDVNIRQAIMDRLGMVSIPDYNTMISTTGIPNLDVQIFISSNRISINNETYNNGELVDDAVYSFSDYIRRSIKSIRCESLSTSPAIFRFNLL